MINTTERNHCSNTLVIHVHMSRPWVTFEWVSLTHTDEWVLPAPLRVWGWCLSSTTCTVSILITLTPRSASTHTHPLLHYVSSLPPSIHPSFFLSLLFSLVTVWISQSASTSSVLHSSGYTATQTRTHRHACLHTRTRTNRLANALSTHIAIDSASSCSPLSE